MMNLQKEVFVIESTKANTVLDYCNDVLFKYTLSYEDEDSVHARNTIIERITGIRVKEGTVQNSNLDPETIGKKHIILDVHVKDGKGRFFNLEMQTTYAGVAKMMRFEFYGAKVLDSQLNGNEKYKDLKPIYQIIFIERCAWNNKNLIDHYRIRSEQGEDESKHPLIRRTYIYLPVINEAAKKETIQRMDDFEQLCFLFEDNARNGILKSKEGLVKVFVNKYEEMQKDDELWSTAMAVQMGEAHHRHDLEGNFKEGTKEGIVKGKVEGKLEGERQLLHKLMKAKFQKDCTAWLQSLTEDQLHIVSNLPLECDTLEELKNRIKVILNNTSR